MELDWLDWTGWSDWTAVAGLFGERGQEPSRGVVFRSTGGASRLACQGTGRSTSMLLDNRQAGGMNGNVDLLARGLAGRHRSVGGGTGKWRRWSSVRTCSDLLVDRHVRTQDI